MVRLRWKTVWRHIEKLKLELTYDPAISLLGVYPKRPKSGSQRDISPPTLIADTIRKGQDVKNNLNVH